MSILPVLAHRTFTQNMSLSLSSGLRVLLEKDGMYGVLGLLEHEGTHLLTSKDERTPKPFVTEEKNAFEARRKFDEGVATSRDRGWKVIYYGRPNYG